MEQDYISQNIDIVEAQTSHKKMLIVVSIAVVLLISLLILMYFNGKYMHESSNPSIESTSQDITSPI